MLADILKRLAEMFPQQDYQSRLEQYISSRYPKSAADVEYYERQYYQRQQSGSYL
jgi:FtsZ-interacting cell division protein YlmF